jgi:hypothetical protein
MCPSWLLLLAIAILMGLIIMRNISEGFTDYDRVGRTYQWLYSNLWFPRYDWDEKNKNVIGTPKRVVDSPREVGQGYVVLKDVAPQNLSGDGTSTSPENIIEQCKAEQINCHNIVTDLRSNLSYVNTFDMNDKLVWSPGFVTYIRQYVDENPMTGQMYNRDVRIN